MKFLLQLLFLLTCFVYSCQTPSDSLIANERIMICSNASGVKNIDIGDIDQDGDMDVIGINYYNDKVYWIEQTSYLKFEKHFIDHLMSYGTDVELIDLDLDGDLDVIASSKRSRGGLV